MKMFVHEPHMFHHFGMEMDHTDCFEPPLEKMRGLEYSQKNRMSFVKHLVFVPSHRHENKKESTQMKFHLTCSACSSIKVWTTFT